MIIKTGLDHFLLIDKISGIDKDRISGERKFLKDPVFLGIEALAQLGALHVRYLFDCNKHAFLLKINKCTFLKNKKLNGTYKINGLLTGKSDRSFLYLLNLSDSSNKIIDAELTFSTIDYNAVFKKDILKGHYEKVIKCLLKN